MIRYRADWLLPIAEPPIADGWLEIENGRIAAYGRDASAAARDARDLGHVAVLPGVVNAHTHLELSYLRDEVPPARDFVTWIRGVVAARRSRPDPASPEIMRAVDDAIREAVACGTALVGDISNTLVTFGPLAASPLGGVVFYELIRFARAGAEEYLRQAMSQLDALIPAGMMRASLAAHAPYSVAPALLQAINRAAARDPTVPISVHVSESAEEVEFIRAGGGPWRQFLEEMSAYDPSWAPPGGSPVEFLDEHGFLDNRVLAVHGVQMTPDDLRRLAARDATLVTCPRSNGHTGAGAPPLADFYASGVRVAVGTDSLASAPDLNVFAELATIRALAPDVPAAALIESATRHGARALGFDAEFGTIQPGKRARLLAVALPPRLDDVEEYLVSGIGPDQLQWLNA